MRPPEPPSPITVHTIGTFSFGHFEQVARNRFGLPALFGADAGIGARGVDEGDSGSLKRSAICIRRSALR
jgi:hypothetical protein